jgi:PIN domain nuclease of toxin-antitoxin system
VKVILDSGAVTFFAQQTRRSDKVLTLLPSNHLVVPSLVLVECLPESPRDARVQRFLRACSIRTELSREEAQYAAQLRRSAQRGSAVDAVVVALANRGDVVVTGDKDDISALVAHAEQVHVVLI